MTTRISLLLGLAAGTSALTLPRRALLRGAAGSAAWCGVTSAHAVCYDAAFAEVECPDAQGLAPDEAETRSASKGGAMDTSAELDVNNMIATEYTIFPGLYPTIGGKLVKRGPFSDKKAMYDSLDSDAERAALRVYDGNLRVKPFNADVVAYKNSQTYFAGKGGDSKKSNAFRDAEIARVQEERRRR